MDAWKIEGKAPVICVIGATGGIGAALCRRLTARGAKLLIGARDGERLHTLAAEIGAHALAIDATQSGQVTHFFNQARQTLGPVDGAVCCAGSLLLKPAHQTSDAEWEQTIASNLTAAFNTLRGAVTQMRERGGTIALCSSAAARHGFANHEAIAAAKAGIIGLTLSAAATYARNGIRVNCVAPGLTKTPLTQGLTESEVLAKASAALHALGRIGEPDDVASALTWLLSPEQSWITGQVIGVDGGLSSVRVR
jgi:3-oxoacyl-[acyl-carrier protein] reductase